MSDEEEKREREKMLCIHKIYVYIYIIKELGGEGARDFFSTSGSINFSFYVAVALYIYFL